jgi:hypothetical protein
MFSDLECDYINPIDLCNKLNQVSYFFVVEKLYPTSRAKIESKFVLLEHFAHAFLWTVFLLSGSWMAMLLNTPLLVYHGQK